MIIHSRGTKNSKLLNRCVNAIEKSVQLMMIVLYYSKVQLSYINARNDHNKIFAETDESKDCRIYRPLIHRNALGIYLNEGGRKNLLTARKLSATKFAQNKSTSDHCHSCGGNDEDTTKRSISAQTDISALPGHWRSDSHLLRGIFVNGVCTLPSNFTNLPGTDLCNHLLKYL